MYDIVSLISLHPPHRFSGLFITDFPTKVLPSILTGCCHLCGSFLTAFGPVDRTGTSRHFSYFLLFCYHQYRLIFFWLTNVTFDGYQTPTVTQAIAVFPSPLASNNHNIIENDSHCKLLWFDQASRELHATKWSSSRRGIGQIAITGNCHLDINKSKTTIVVALERKSEDCH